MHTVDAEHRQHAEVELAIRDLKDQALAHFPSGSFAANAAWTVIACLAHNMARWVGQLGLEDETWRAARTIRRWLIALPGRLTRTARRTTLHLPARWPWREAFVEALDQDQGAAGRGLTSLFTGFASPAESLGAAGCSQSATARARRLVAAPQTRTGAPTADGFRRSHGRRRRCRYP